MTNVIEFPLEKTNYDIPQQILEEGRRIGLTDDHIRSSYRLAQEMAADIRLLKEIREAELEAEEQRQREQDIITAHQRDIVGSKYAEHGHKDAKKIAKLIRKDIKDAIKRGDLPQGLKTSVRIERYSGGQSINLFIKDVGDLKIYNEAAEKNLREHGQIHTTFDQTSDDYLDEIYTDEYKATKKYLEQIHGAYNYDNSDPMTDYFSVNYYGGVSLDYKYENDVKDAIKS